MFKINYLTTIIVIIILLIIYYLYHEISKTKKIFAPAYEKTLDLDEKMIELNKKVIELDEKIIKNKSKNDSPALSITYQSNIKNNDSNVKYSNFSDTEANKILKNIKKEKKEKKIKKKKNEETDTINIKIDDIMDNNISEYNKIIKNLDNPIDIYSDVKNELDYDIIKSISESVKNNDILSDIPKRIKKKKTPNAV